VKNPHGVQQGIKEIKVNGQAISGTTIPLANTPECQVAVIMG
jgi:hypothetical protein